MFIDMKFFNIYYFCQIANSNMGTFDAVNKNGEFTESFFSESADIKDFPKISVLRHYCYWLIQNVFYEQADLISQDEATDFNPINWALQAIYIYKEMDLTNAVIETQQNEDYLEYYNGFIENLNESYSDIFEEVVWKIATEMEHILFHNRDFLLRFNEQQATAFESNQRKRKAIPAWVKKAVMYRDNGKCVFCKKDLSGAFSRLDSREIHFDHIVPLNKGGINDVCNIQLSCQKCNLSKKVVAKTNTHYQTIYEYTNKI